MEPKPHWLNKTSMAASLGITVQAFDKWKVAPVARIGRENFYDVRSILDNRLALAEQKAEAAQGVDGIDPLIEYKLMVERQGLTAAQRIAQEKKNEIADKQLVPVEFAIFALSKIAAQLGSLLDTVPLQLKRKHPEIDVRHVESLQREIALARNLAADSGERLPEFLDEYLDSLAD
ncbi:terminase small subunit [Pseudomonas gingeri]|uniref:terminase small subunit n=1 Tax=Pseudomonas gingeri TaxID=117681 RepID=UPI0015BFB9EB|nr:terminase small subunit [Pseudomonas gingeri]NWD49031.1 terminase small subunit [Pseudomonas gingeri]